jgi:mannonate dehydratase
MAREFGERIHFVHLRNVTREHDGSFYEAEHLDGDNDLISLLSALLKQESARSQSGGTLSEIPMRPDHGHTMGDELEHGGVNPGYSYVGRLKGLAELRGVIRTLEWQDRGASQ